MSENSLGNGTVDKENETTFISQRVGSLKISKREKLDLESRLLSVTQSLNELREKEFTFANVPQVAEDLGKKLKLCNGYSKIAYESAAVKSIGLDSAYFVSASALNCNLVKATEIDYHTFDCTTFAEKLITKLNAGGRVDSIVSGSRTNTLSVYDFESLATQFGNLITDVPSFNFMYGAFNSEELVKEQKERKVRKLKVDGPLKKPETVDAKDINGNKDDLTAKSVEVLFNKVRKSSKNKPNVPYFKLVSDPTSFSKTVENVFHSAFLVKEGIVDLSMSENGSKPVLKCVNTDEEETRGANTQAVLSFSMEEWKKWIEECNSQESE